uniref:Cytochrome b n=1 Tax=Lamprigera yunnana TaxID=370605 RepID=A0A5C0PWP6_9COLE|nr:cytochrome b [Lamprigera yunnana]QEJ81511.1 cytochrome b [Lamprigera yunnana]
MKIQKKYPIIKILNNSLIDLPTPTNISNWWNMGSLLGVCLIIQMITGMFLTMHYCPNINLAFDSVAHISHNVNKGWLIRTIHANGASMFFIALYLHMGRGIYYSSFTLKKTWLMGNIIFIMTMASAFLGYILPWGQMSFWGATVITNLLSTIPYIGNEIVQWLWGSYTVSNPTLNRFFTLHFITPFMIIAMVMIHLMFLHESGSNNPLGTNSNMNKIPFYPYFVIKDLMSLMITFSFFSIIILFKPYILSNPDNFIPANSMVTPIHIEPEWYFLYSYAILRSIPNKLGGVIALFMSITILFTLTLINKKMKSNSFYPMNKMLFFLFSWTFILLTWLGSKPVMEPFIFSSQLLTLIFFMFFPLNLYLYKMWDFMIK